MIRTDPIDARAGARQATRVQVDGPSASKRRMPGALLGAAARVAVTPGGS